MAGLLVQACQFSGVYLGPRMGVPASVTALIISCTAVLTAVVAAWVFRVRTGPKQVVGLVLGVAAVLAPLRDWLGSFGTGAMFTVLGMLGFVAGAGADREIPGDRLAATLADTGVPRARQLDGRGVAVPRGRPQGGAAAMTTLSSVVPSVTALIAWPLLGQVPTAGVVAGLVLGFGACWLGTATQSSSVARTAVEERASGR